MPRLALSAARVLVKNVIKVQKIHLGNNTRLEVRESIPVMAKSIGSAKTG